MWQSPRKGGIMAKELSLETTEANLLSPVLVSKVKDNILRCEQLLAQYNQLITTIGCKKARYEDLLTHLEFLAKSGSSLTEYDQIVKELFNL